MKKVLFLILFCFVVTGCTPKKAPVPSTRLSPEAIGLMKEERGYWIEVQIPQRKLILAKGPHILKTYAIAVGMPSYPSPVGNRRINQVVWNPWWYPPKTSDWVTDPTPVPPRSQKNPLGEVKMPLGKDAYLIHGTSAVRSIGTWASHGCIRMLFEDIFGLVQLMMTQYSNHSAIDEMEKANRYPSQEFKTHLTRDIPVVLRYDTVKVDKGYVTISPDIYKRHPNFVAHIADSISPYLEKTQAPNQRKIKKYLSLFRNQTIHVPLASLIHPSL